MTRHPFLDPNDYDSNDAKVEALLACLKASSQQDYIGESISQLEHALQAAACGIQNASPEAVILGALFHDVGHLIASDAPNMAGLGVVDHETIGANLLLNFGCSEQTADLVRYHVQAKRYLCFKKPRYFDRLSDASKGTLQWQGGPMSEGEAAEFEALSDFSNILAVRAWDERAKDPEAIVPDLEHYRPILKRHLDRNLPQGVPHV